MPDNMMDNETRQMMKQLVNSLDEMLANVPWADYKNDPDQNIYPWINRARKAFSEGLEYWKTH